MIFVDREGPIGKKIGIEKKMKVFSNNIGEKLSLIEVLSNTMLKI